MADDTAQDKAETPMMVDELAPGTKLMNGSYTIEKFLNAGGFGITYSARDSLDRRVVIKECFPGAFCRRSQYFVTARSRAHQKELTSMVTLFVQEARSLAKLVHPNIVGVHQIFEENNTAYMALDFVEGRDLLDVIEKGDITLTPAQVENILRKVLDAVSFVHAAGILHRDISPDNILLDDRFEPVLIDFGAAREEATRKSRVLSALRVVKDGYSPQEFYVAGSEQGPYSDLYSLAASFYHLITGKLPPDSQVRVSALASGEGDPYEPLEGQVPQLPVNFLRALDRALNVLPRDRLQSAKEWLEMLDGVEPVRRATRALSRAAAAESEPTSSRGMVLASVATLALLGGGGFIGWQTGLIGGEPTAVTAEEPDAPNAVTVAEANTVSPETPAPSENSVAEIEDTPVPSFDASQPEVAGSDAGSDEQAPPTVADPLANTDFATADAAVETDVPLEATGIEELGRAASAPPRRPQTAVAALQDGPDAPSATSALEQSTELASVEPVNSSANAPSIEEVDGQSEALGIDVDSAPAIDADSGELVLSQATTTDVSRIEGISASDDAPAIAGLSASLSADVTTPDTPPTEDEAPLSLSEFLQRATDDAADGGPNFVAAPVIAAPSDEVESLVQVSRTLELPFDDLFEDAVGNLRLFSVEGTAVSTREDFDSIVDEMQLENGSANITVSFGVAEETAVDAEWELPVMYQINTANGLTFETRQVEGGAWQTSVGSVPAGMSDVLNSGDVVVGLLDTSERIDTPTVFVEILERELANEKDSLNLAILREGAMWGINISLADLRTASAN